MDIHTFIKLILISFFCFYTSKINATNFIEYDHQIKGSHSYTNAKMIDGELWISTGRGLIVQSGGASRHILLKPPYSDEIYTINQAGKDSLWLGTNKGLYLFDLQKEEVVAQAKFENGEAFEYSVINALSFNNNQLIIGTNRNGIYYVNNNTYVVESKVRLSHNAGIKSDDSYVFNLIKTGNRIFATILPKYVYSSAQMIELIGDKGQIIHAQDASTRISNIDIDQEHIWLFGNKSIKKMTKNMELLQEFLIPFNGDADENMHRKTLQISEGHYLILMRRNGILEFNNGDFKQYRLKGESQSMRAMIKDDYGSIFVIARLDIYVSYEGLNKVDLYQINKYRSDGEKQPGDHFLIFQLLRMNFF